MGAKEEFRKSMFSKISQWQSSGLSQKTFCEQHNIKYFVFHYWYKQYRDKHPKEVSGPGKFIKLNAAVIGGDFFAELVLNNGNRVIFHQLVALDYLSALLK